MLPKPRKTSLLATIKLNDEIMKMQNLFSQKIEHQKITKKSTRQIELCLRRPKTRCRNLSEFSRDVFQSRLKLHSKNPKLCVLSDQIVAWKAQFCRSFLRKIGKYRRSCKSICANNPNRTQIPISAVNVNVWDSLKLFTSINSTNLL